MIYENLDSVIFTTKGFICIPVHFNHNFYESLLKDLEFFQINYLLPYIKRLYT